MNKQQTLHEFWSSFGLKAYDETTVPEYVDDGHGNKVKLEPPYITYEVSTDSFGYAVALSASLRYRDSSWAAITLKENQISDRIGRGGVIVDYEGGAIWIRRGSPWATRMEEPTDDTIRRIVLNTSVEYFD